MSTQRRPLALALRQATRRFGELPGAAEALAAISTLANLESVVQRALTAPHWSALIGGS